MALYGWPVAQCQSMTLSQQLDAGIRVLDIRLSVDKEANVLRAYHGSLSMRVDWPTILEDLHAFLAANPRETLVVSLKQEDYGQEEWNRLLVDGIEKSKGGWRMWFIDGRVPKLGEVRGRCVMFSRFGPRGYPGEKGWGIHPTTWPDSLKGTFEWNCGDTIVRTQDW
jgi:1-phosphatidylinositol phosphodiesterase